MRMKPSMSLQKNLRANVLPFAKTAWRAQRKKDVFLGKFAFGNLQKNFEEAVAGAELETIGNLRNGEVAILRCHFYSHHVVENACLRNGEEVARR